MHQQMLSINKSVQEAKKCTLSHTFIPLYIIYIYFFFWNLSFYTENVVQLVSNGGAKKYWWNDLGLQVRKKFLYDFHVYESNFVETRIK